MNDGDDLDPVIVHRVNQPVDALDPFTNVAASVLWNLLARERVAPQADASEQ